MIKNVKRAVEEEEEDFQALLTNNKNGLTCKSSSKFGGKRRKLTQRGKGTCSSNTTPNSSNDSNNSVTGNEIDVRIRGSLFSLHDNKTSNIGQSDGKNSGANNFKSDNCEVRAAFVDGDLRVGDSVHVFENNVRSDELELVEIASLGLGDIFGRIMSSDDFRYMCGFNTINSRSKTCRRIVSSLDTRIYLSLYGCVPSPSFFSFQNPVACSRTKLTVHPTLRNPFSVIAESEVALLRLPTSSLKERVTPSTIKKLAYLLDIYDCTGEEASDKAHESRYTKVDNCRFLCGSVENESLCMSACGILVYINANILQRSWVVHVANTNGCVL